MKSKGVVILLAALMVLALAGGAAAANFTWSVDGANEVTQGQSVITPVI